MARIVAGIGSSHVPSFGPAYDARKFEEPDWKPLFDGYAPVKQWLQESVKPDVAIFVYNDHGSDFSLDRVPTFSIGVRDEYEQADEGFGLRPLPRVKGDAAFSWHLASALIYDEFDLTVCQEMKVDHGLMAPLPLLFSHDPDWSVRVVPLVVNVIQPHRSSICYMFLVKCLLHMDMSNLFTISDNFGLPNDCMILVGEYLGCKKNG